MPNGFPSVHIEQGNDHLHTLHMSRSSFKTRRIFCRALNFTVDALKITSHDR